MDQRIHITPDIARILALLIDDQHTDSSAVALLNDQQIIAAADRAKYWSF
jgi:hypothetical protein